MRQILGLLLVCTVFVFCNTSCNRIDYTFAAIMAGVGQMCGGMASDTESFNSAPPSGTQSSGMSIMSINKSNAPTLGSDGWISNSKAFLGRTLSWRYQFLDENSVAVTSDTVLGVWNEAQVRAKRMHFIETFVGPHGTFNADLWFTRDNVGQKGGTVSGSCSGSNDEGGSFSATFNSLRGKGDGSGTLVGGTITASFSSVRGKACSITMTFKSDGSADGKITSGSYSADIHLNPDKTGYYTDSEGKHEIGTPVRAAS